MQENDTYLDDAVYLVRIAAEHGKEPVAFYDERDQTVHSYENGILQIATDFADYRSYALRLDGGVLKAELHLPSGGRVDVLELDEDDKDDLTERLRQVAGQVRSYRSVANTDMRPVWKRLMKTLFPRMPFGQPGYPFPRMVKSDVAGSVRRALSEAGLLFEWECKTWNDVGVHALNTECMLLVANDIVLPQPSQQEQRAVFASGDFSGAILDWFDQQLGPDGMTLIALAPFDEFQSFALVDADSVDQIRELLGQIGVGIMTAGAYAAA